MASLSTLDPRFRPMAVAFVEAAKRAGYRPTVTSARRSRAKQAALYRAFLDGRMPYTVLPPGRSKHESGMAFDMVSAYGTKALAKLGAVWRAWGGHWAGPSDPVHFEAPR